MIINRILKDKNFPLKNFIENIEWKILVWTLYLRSNRKIWDKPNGRKFHHFFPSSLHLACSLIRQESYRSRYRLTITSQVTVHTYTIWNMIVFIQFINTMLLTKFTNNNLLLWDDFTYHEGLQTFLISK